MNIEQLNDQLHVLSHNLCIYYSKLVDDIHLRLMTKAIAAGHQGLKLSHALILPQIAADGSRIIDIARSQGISKQAIGQVAGELEKLGFIKKISDPADKRSKKLTLTSKGVTLIRQSADFMYDVDNELQDQIGKNHFKQLQNLSRKLFKAMALKFPDAGQYTPELDRQLPLIVYATSISNHLDLLLKQINHEKGHPPLKRSYWHVLEKILQKGIRINELAELNGISKQAVSQLANEIEKAGYIKRIHDPKDKRSRKLVLTDKGKELIRHTMESTRAVETLVEQQMGSKDYQQLKHCLYYYTQPPTRATDTSGQPPFDLARQLLSAIESIIKRDPQNISHPWLIQRGNSYLLSETAIEALKNFELKID